MAAPRRRPGTMVPKAAGKRLGMIETAATILLAVTNGETVIIELKRKDGTGLTFEIDADALVELVQELGYRVTGPFPDAAETVE